MAKAQKETTPPAPTTAKASAGSTDNGTSEASLDALDVKIKALLSENEPKILALPDFKIPESRDEAIALLAKIGIDPCAQESQEPSPAEPAPTEQSPTEPTKDDEDSEITEPATEPITSAAAPLADSSQVKSFPSGIVLSKECEELTWTDESHGQFGYLVETSHDEYCWRDEVRLPAGTSRYSPRPTPPSKTDFYRIRLVGSDGVSAVDHSNVVVIHFA